MGNCVGSGNKYSNNEKAMQSMAKLDNTIRQQTNRLRLLEKQISEIKSQAQYAMENGKKPEAISLMKRAKGLESQVKATRSSVETFHAQKQQIQVGLNTANVTEAMQQGNVAVTKLTNRPNIDDIDETLNDIREQEIETGMVLDALNQSVLDGGDDDDDALLAELQQQTAATSATSALPPVPPRHKLPEMEQALLAGM